jgi:predicted nuclease of predicted toxin-antitoxin system
MRFLADMGISPRTVAFLNAIGQEAFHLHDENLDEMPDSEILAKAKAEACILLTHDLDFGELLAMSGDVFPTIITFRLRNMTPDNVNHHLAEIIRQHGEALKNGVAMTVTEKRIRIHPLPI